MKVAEMLGRRTDPRGELGDYDDGIRDVYVDKFVSALGADLDEPAKAEQIFIVHSAISHEHDLYIAVFEMLNAGQRRAIKEYVRLYGHSTDTHPSRL